MLRLLDLNAVLLPLEVLGMSEGVLSRFLTELTHPHGMIAVCGPTGSGKTTTLYAALGQLDASRRNILTIEDPIEYHLPDIGQIQVRPKLGLTFANGLRHILRQDPDIVLVGETRDIETAEIAVRASLTGHLVFTTLHTNDAAGAVLRFVDMGVEPYLLASCLRAVLAQRLVRVLCPACKVSIEVGVDDQTAPAEVRNLVAGRRVWQPVGCAKCLEGYAGRAGLFELAVVEGEIQAMVRSGKASVAALRAAAATQGMVSLLDDGVAKVLAGMTSLPEILAVAG